MNKKRGDNPKHRLLTTEIKLLVTWREGRGFGNRAMGVKSTRAVTSSG